MDVRITATTRIRRGDTAVPLSQLKAGDHVSVKGERNAGKTLTAVEIELDDEQDDNEARQELDSLFQERQYSPMKSASVTDVKNNLSKYLEVVKSGESVLITERGIVIARIESVRAQQGETADQARLARLERAGVVRRGRPISRKLINETPPSGSKGASALQALLDERRSGR